MAVALRLHGFLEKWQNLSKRQKQFFTVLTLLGTLLVCPIFFFKNLMKKHIE